MGARHPSKGWRRQRGHWRQPSSPELPTLGRALGLLLDVRIASSTEPKAISTAQALSEAPPLVMPEFAEVEKPWFENPNEHRTATLDYLAGARLRGWEPLTIAAARFNTGLQRLGANPVVVTHGTVMTAWLAAVHVIEDPATFWLGLRMPDAFVVDVDHATCGRRPRAR